MEKWTLMFLPAILRDLSLKRVLLAIPHQVALPDLESAAVVLLLRRMKDELSRQEKHWREIVRLKLEIFLWLLKRAGGRPSPPPFISPLAVGGKPRHKNGRLGRKCRVQGFRHIQPDVQAIGRNHPRRL